MSDKRNQSLFLEILSSLSDGQKLVGAILASGFVVACLFAIIAVGLLEPPVETVVEPTTDPQPNPTPPSKPTPPYSRKIKIEIDYKKLIAKLEFERTPYYIIYRKPTNELIQGEVGNYFYVDILDPDTQEKILFRPGQYTLGEVDDDKFGQSLGKFQKDILAPARDKELKPQILIRGMADKLAPNFSNPFVPIPIEDCTNPESAKITYHPSKNESLYSKQPITKEVGGSYGNRDLPDLRALFLMCRYKELYPEPVKIIEGVVDDRISSESRNGTFILYLPELEDQSE